MKNMILSFGVAVLAVLAVGTQASAQRSAEYETARGQGLIGEKPDGYLGIVGNAPANVQRMVDDINIKRKAAYTQRAPQNGSTVEQFAFISGCNLIARTQPGEKYMAPDGSWKTCTSAAPERDSRCP